jgi:uncharacterized protein (TIGR02757 family)
VINRDKLESIYQKYNKRDLVHPDPLEFLYNYSEKESRELVALIASTLAYGRVAQILKSVNYILDKMQPDPVRFVKENSKEEFLKIFKGFKHRFTTGQEIAYLMTGIQAALEQFGSLENCFKSNYRPQDENIIPALDQFIEFILREFEVETTHLLPHPKRGSACKRSMLFLRWMVRNDEVDPGCWKGIPTSALIIPLDTHMHKIGLKFELTKRKQANLKTAVEITDAFKKIIPEDPVKYDFALTRFGIRKGMQGIGRIEDE